MNELSPSNSLLSAVLGIKCEHNDYVISSADCMFTNYKAMNKTLRFKVTENLHIFEKYPEKRLKEINLSVFMEMCKEWAYNQGYDMLSGGLEAGLHSCYIDYSDKRYTLSMKPINHFFADSEQQAVFDACQYILDKKEK